MQPVKALVSADVRDVPIYSLVDAAGYVRVPSSTLSTWVSASGVIRPAAAPPPTLSFSNLVEVFVLSAMRRKHNIPMQRIRKAVEYVQERLGVERPLIHGRFRTDGVDLFVERFGKLENVSTKGQMAMREIVGRYLARLDYEEEVASRFFPFVRAGDDEQPRAVVIDPHFGFGKPVIFGTGIRTSIVGRTR
jgi:hypothetical protein